MLGWRKYKIALSICGSEDNIAHTFHHGVESLDNWHRLIDQHFALDSIDWLSIFHLMSRSWILSDRHYLFLVFTSLVFAFFVSFSFETIDNTSLLFSSSLLLRLFFSATSTSAHGPRREQRCCFLLTPPLNLSASFCLSFSVCIIMFVLTVNAPSSARLEWVLIKAWLPDSGVDKERATNPRLQAFITESI